MQDLGAAAHVVCSVIHDFRHDSVGGPCGPGLFHSFVCLRGGKRPEVDGMEHSWSTPDSEDIEVGS